jgi:hypothetical protein
MCSISEITDDNALHNNGCLKNVRHEMFAQQLVLAHKFAWTRGAAYSRAGYKAEGESAEAAASRLLGNVKSGVAARVAELAGAGARRAEVTAASLIEKLDRVYDGASAAAQFSAAGRAVEAQAKISGVGAADRVEVNQVGSFGGGFSLEELVRDIGHGDPAVALASFDEVMGEIRAELLELAAAHAKVIADAPSASQRPNEAALALELLRPRRRGGR